MPTSSRLVPALARALFALACPVSALASSMSALACAVFAFAVMVPVAAVAQFENGSIVGTVHDSTGAAVPGATVTATNAATGVVTTRATADSGAYEVPNLRVGQYNVTVSHAGFADARATDISVTVAGRQRIDLTMNVGSVQASVEVSGIALQVETDTSQRDQTITQAQSEALPIINRNYSDLLGLVTGVRQAPTAATTSSINSLVRQGAYNVNGQRSMFNNFLLDGMDNNAYGESNQGFDNQIIAVPPDSVAQFSVVTNNESAEYGRSSGATINVASASGGNQFHGTIYDFFRNTVLNAAGFFKPTLGAVPFRKPVFNRNQYGINIGGPILRDHLFFFLDYEGFRQLLKPLAVGTLPTQNELNGILVVGVRNPVTGAVYPAGSPIPTSAISPLSRQIVNYFKQIPGLPAAGLTTTGLSANDYAVQVPFSDNADKGDLRLDFQQDQRNSYFLRVSDRKENAVNFPVFPLPLDGQTNGNIRVLSQQVAAGYTHLFGSNRILDARLGLSRTKAGKYTLSIGNNAFTIPGLPSNPIVSGGLPSTAITGFTSFGRQSTNPQWQNPALLDPKLNYTWVKGNHSLKFGYEYEKVWMAVNDNNPLYGSYSFGGGYSLCTVATSAQCAATASGTPQTAAVSDNYWADFLFGNTNSYSLANFFVVHLRQSLQSAYAQDDWKVNAKLTLNLGVRWEYGSPYTELNNYISNFDPVSQTVLTLTPGAVAGNGITPFTGSGVYGRSLLNPDLNDFAPRVGFAFAANPTTSVRGGFGTSYVHYYRAGSGNILAINAPQAQFAGVTQITPTATNHCNPVPAQIIAVGSTTPSCYATIDQGFPSALVTAFNPATDNITYVPKDTKDSYVASYFLSVQQQLAKNSLLDIAYVGNRGLKLQGFLNANQKNPSLGFARPYANWPSDITTALNGFVSNYNSLQARFELRNVAGITLLNSFTWEHSLDNASASLEANTPSPQDANNLKADYSQSDYNLPVANITSLVYDLPFGRGRRFLSRANGFVDPILGGWQISLINTAQAGTPFNLTYTPNSATAVSPLISATFRGANEYRPNVSPTSTQPLTQGRTSRAAGTGYVNYVNYAALSLPATRSASGALLSPFGNASRNPGRTPAFYETDFGLNKKFSTPLERLKVEFRAEFYNLFNHTNLYLPSSGLGGTLGGAPLSGGVVTSTFQPRIVQLGLKVLF